MQLVMAGISHQDDILSDGYIECADCGHTLEGAHTTDGCTQGGCPCRIGWTRAAVRKLRKEAGLPAQYKPEEF